MLPPFLRHIELLADTIADPDRYPFSIPAIRHLKTLTFHPNVTFLVGENGSGKSTLLEAIAIKAGFHPDGGSKDSTAPADQSSRSSLHHHIGLVRGARRELSGFFLRAETVLNIPAESESHGWSGLDEKSHGESLMWVMVNRFRMGGVYVLDEPEAALSPQRQISCLLRIHQLVQGGSQLIIATHSPILMAYPQAKIILLGPQGCQEVAYQQTEHYQVTRTFLKDPAKMLERMFKSLGN